MKGVQHLNTNIIWFCTHNSKRLCNNKRLIIGERLYNREHSEINIFVCNHSKQTQSISPHTLLGYSNEVVMGELETLNINCIVDKYESPEERDSSKLTMKQRLK